jgi:hypothetical protein
MIWRFNWILTVQQILTSEPAPKTLKKMSNQTTVSLKLSMEGILQN